MSSAKLIHIYYSGMVQGIGFRYTVERLASQLGICGWVRNLPDGRVEMEAEGTEETLKELCGRIEERFGGYIKSQEKTERQASSRYKDFRIVH